MQRCLKIKKGVPELMFRIMPLPRALFARNPIVGYKAGMKIVARLLALFISLSAQSSWGVMRLSQDQQGEVLIYPFYRAQRLY